MESMELGHAEKIIGVGSKYNMQHVLKCFEIVHWAKKQNREFDLMPTTIEARNAIVRHLVTEQKKKFRFFEIESPYENTCPKCKGSGEIFKFFKKSVKVNCHICGGASTITETCPKCKKTPGRFVRRWKEGGGVDLKCKRCDGTAKVKLSCQECKGKGKIEKPVLSDDLKSTTPCKKCRELGFISKDSPKPKKKKYHSHQRRPFNPISKFTSKGGRTLADVIKGS
jgi:hypothetical protein